MLKNKLNLFVTIVFLILYSIDLKAKEEKNENKEFSKEYTGPKLVTKNIEIIYTEEAKLKARIVAKEGHQFNNKDAIYPKGIFVEFYDKEENITGTLKADYVKYDSKQNIYKITGNVEVKNQKKREILKTTELTWLPDEEKIYSKETTFVKIITKDINLIGKGIDANQDLSKYKIKDLKGTIKIRKNESKEKNLPIEYNIKA